MSHQYQAIAWNRQKRVYDIVLVTGVTLYLTLFIGVSAFLFPYATATTLTIRAAGSAAFLLLHIVLCIGPLCRLDPKFLPLLYNRRHLGRIPPVFAANDFNGSPAVLLLTGPNQKRLPREAFLDRIARPMRIRGRVMQTGNTLLLETESSALSSPPFSASTRARTIGDQ